ncbi:hypothetical protein CAPN004_21840 [Capnocytophaga cynodegmi]|uniref:hypothetical protein n=1 Tax=Capnocytophaga cynodegmi TaxID=28189 RepID=UPI001AC6427D|nr:hypothetical protein [Capnocytophaga cynodegmi]GIM53154.1 hypothetical protein CAPN004_21840 [Capnocytophaga cynodegmi]
MEIKDVIPLLFLEQTPEILELIDITDDSFLKEPLFFAFFNSKKEYGVLNEIIQGYLLKNSNLKIEHSLNKNRIAYIPKLGYFNEEKKLVDDILVIEELEIIKELHPLLEPYLFEYYKGHITNHNPTYIPTWKDHIDLFKQAITLIKNHLPLFFQDFQFANKKIFFHNNTKILNFTSIETLGMLYFYTSDNTTLMYFIEELIHQGAHNILYHKLFFRKDFFIIDPVKSIMRDFTKQAWDYRDIYGAFHGVYTVLKRLECYDILIKKNILKGKDKHELFGRLADQFPRFRTGLELLDLDEVYTKKGKELYLELDKKCETILKKYEKIVPFFDLSFRDLDFNYSDFIIANPIDDFLEAEKKGFFNF